MSVPVVTICGSKGGVGTTTLVYHLAWMLSDLRLRVVAADLAPQANLTTMFLPEDDIARIYDADTVTGTMYAAVEPLKEGIGDIRVPDAESIGGRIFLIPGDIALSNFEDVLSEVWPKCADGDPRAFRCTTAFSRIIQSVAESHEADLVLVDVGSSLGAINRAAMIASDHVVIPLVPDIFSLQGLRNLGPRLREWRSRWRERVPKSPLEEPPPAGGMDPIGYVVHQTPQRLDRPVKAYARWVERIPEFYNRHVLEKGSWPASYDKDDACLKSLRHFASLMPMAQEARKPMFHLKAADGALGAHGTAAREVGKQFRELAEKILSRIGVDLPD